jgi:hypothetical protein
MKPSKRSPTLSRTFDEMESLTGSLFWAADTGG